MKRLIEEEQRRQDRTSQIFLGGLVALAAVLLVVQVLIANRLVEASDKLRNLDLQIATMEDQNQSLSEGVRTKESLVAISDQAKTLGFLLSGQISYLSAFQPVAMNGVSGVVLR